VEPCYKERRQPCYMVFWQNILSAAMCKRLERAHPFRTVFVGLRFANPTYMTLLDNGIIVEIKKFKDDYMKYTCPCCGYKTLTEPPPGTYDICPICCWEDDAVQFDDPDYAGGANTVSLRQAQINFLKSGASESKFLRIVRDSKDMYERDPNFKPLKG